MSIGIFSLLGVISSAILRGELVRCGQSAQVNSPVYRETSVFLEELREGHFFLGGDQCEHLVLW
jgi:hypothetical protein